MSSHEAYVPPSSQTFQPGSTFGAAGGAGGSALDPRSAPMEYTCADCAAKVVLRKGDQIRCRECGHRVLYKQRTKRMVQFEAR